jgi:hypothetical protein
MRSRASTGVEKKTRWPRRTGIALGMVAVVGGFSTCSADVSQSVKKPGVGELKYVKFTKPSLLVAEFGGPLKGIDVKRNEHTPYTPSWTDRTYTCTLSPDIVSKVSVDLEPITKRGGIKKEADGKFHVTVQATNDNKTSDVHLISYVQNPTDMNVHCNKNQMAKTVDGISGIVDILPLVNLNNAASHISPLAGYGQLMAIENYNKECSKPAYDVLTKNLGKVLINNLIGDARTQLANEYHVPQSETDVSEKDFVFDFPKDFTSLPDQYGPLADQINKKMNGKNQGLGADMDLPECRIELGS